MAISPISSNSLAQAAYVNPYAKAEQTTSVPQANQDAQRAPQTAKSDTVTISPEALQMAGKEEKQLMSSTQEDEKRKRQPLVGRRD